MDNHHQKISHLKALYHLANIDSYYTETEAVYIKIVADRLGIRHEELNKFDGSEPDLVLPDREYKLYSLFHRLAIIIMIDNAIDENEKRYCINLGIRMGLHPNAIIEIVEHAIENGAMKTLPTDVIEIFRKYQN